MRVLGISQNTLARDVDMAVARNNDIIRARSGIGADTACVWRSASTHGSVLAWTKNQESGPSTPHRGRIIGARTLNAGYWSFFANGG